MQMMQKRSRSSSSSNVSRRAWNILRLALLWARKGGVFTLKKRLMLDLSHFVKSLRHTNPKGNGALQYGDRQLSFDRTPIIHVRMSRPNSMRFKLPRIPCINPHVDCSDIFDHFDEESERYSSYGARTSFLIGNGEECYDDDEDEGQDECGDDQICEEQGIDVKAEEFIANFYEQLKLQRQVNNARRRSD